MSQTLSVVRNKFASELTSYAIPTLPRKKSTYEAGKNTINEFLSVIIPVLLPGLLFAVWTSSPIGHKDQLNSCSLKSSQENGPSFFVGFPLATTYVIQTFVHRVCKVQQVHNYDWRFAPRTLKQRITYISVANSRGRLALW